MAHLNGYAFYFALVLSLMIGGCQVQAECQSKADFQQCWDQKVSAWKIAEKRQDTDKVCRIFLSLNDCYKDCTEWESLFNVLMRVSIVTLHLLALSSTFLKV